MVVGCANRDEPKDRHGETSDLGVEAGFARLGGANEDDPNGRQGEISNAVDTGFETVSKSGCAIGRSMGYGESGGTVFSSSCSTGSACAGQGVEGGESFAMVGVEDCRCGFLGCFGHRWLFPEQSL